jgi:APA family basic amino acid/polyamine antiporter
MAIKAKLTTFDTTMIVVSLVIGIGIFRTPAMVADATQTPFRFFAAWILGGSISLLGTLTFAEIGSRFPQPGAYYKVVLDSYHSSLAFMFNWAGILIANGAGAAAVAIIGSEYLVPIPMPPRYQTQFLIQITAAILVLFLFLINFRGIKTGAWAQNFLTLLKIGQKASQTVSGRKTSTE